MDATDEPAVAAAMRDPGIIRWNTGVAIARSPEAHRAAMWLRVREHGWASGAAAHFTVADATTGALLGTVGIRDINRLPEQALASYWTAPEARGQGVAPQALDVLSRWAFARSRPAGSGCTGSASTTRWRTRAPAGSPRRPDSGSRGPCAGPSSRTTAGATTRTCTPGWPPTMSPGTHEQTKNAATRNSD